MIKEQIEEMARDLQETQDYEGCDAWHCNGCEYEKYNGNYLCESIMQAERLIAKGYRKQSENVVELPFKVGDTVYVPWRWGGQRAIATVRVEEIKFYDAQMHYMFLIDMESDNECFNQSFGGWKTDQCVGKTIFLTREEAEAKMKGGAEE